MSELESEAGAVERIRQELEASEELVWADRPVARAYGRQALPIMLMGGVLLLFATAWECMALWMVMSYQRSNANPSWIPLIFPVMGVLLIGLSVLMLSSPLLMRRRAQRVVYAVTDRRAIVVSSGFGGEYVKSYASAEVGSVTRREHRDGTGDVMFGEMRNLLEAVSRSGLSGSVRRGWTGFIGVREPREVERMLRALAETARG